MIEKQIYKNRMEKRDFRWNAHTQMHWKQCHNPKTRKNVVLTVNVIERLFGLPFIMCCVVLQSLCSNVLFIYLFFRLFIFDSFVWCMHKCLQMMQTSYWLALLLLLFLFLFFVFPYNTLFLAFWIRFLCNIHWFVYLFVYLVFFLSFFRSCGIFLSLTSE